MDKLNSDFYNILPEDIIESTWQSTYQKNIEFIWWNLVSLNSCVFILEKLFSFPFDVFDPEPPPRNFWRLVENSLFEKCVLLIWGIAVDNDYFEGLTIQQFKNEIIKHIKDDKLASLFKTNLKNLKFEKYLSIYKNRIKEIRHNYVAHFNLEKNSDPSPEEIKNRTLLFNELKNIRNNFNSFFELLCFGHQRSLLPIDYNLEIQKSSTDFKTDIEHVLDLIVKNSYIFSLPESNPDLWKHKRRNISCTKLNIINNYRVKFGLSEIE